MKYRTLAKAGGCIFLSFGSLFFVSVHLFGGLGGIFGGHWVHFGVIWVALWGHFSGFFRVRWIFENICFTIIKQYFLRSGRVLDRDCFVLCFWIYAFRLLLVKF